MVAKENEFMEKHNHYQAKNITILISVLFTLTYCKSSDIYKSDPLQLNELVFEEHVHIYDSNAYKESKKKISREMINSLKEKALLESSLRGETLDSNQVNRIGEVISALIENVSTESIDNVEQIDIHYKFQDSLIVSYKKSDGFVDELGGYHVINRNNSTFYTLLGMDSATVFISRRPYEWRDEIDLSIKEYRSQKKNIKGTDCFKIVVKVNDFVDEDAPDSLNEGTLEYTMYVTDRFQSLFHPIVWYKTVLTKYYPLEIIERSNVKQGKETIYLLKTLK